MLSVHSLSVPQAPAASVRAGVDRNLQLAAAVVERMAQMLEGLADTAIAVPRSEWTVGEHGAHIAYANIGFGIFALGMEYPHGDGTRAGLAEANDVALVGFPERDGAVLAATLRQAMDTFATAVAAAPDDQLCRTPLGAMRLPTMTSYFLIHNLMHGCAIATGLSRDLPFRPEHLPQLWPLVEHAYPGFVTPAALAGVGGQVALRVAGGFDRALRVEDGELRFGAAPSGPADCVVEAQPMHFFLVLIKLLTVAEAVDLGHMRVSGPDPDLFARILHAVDVP